MTRNLKLFGATFLLSIPFWLGLNIFAEYLEDFFFWSELADNPKVFAAQANLQEQVFQARPVFKNGTSNLSLEAESAISVFVSKDQKTKVLFEKEPETRLPIASVTKLMNAFVVARHFPLEEEIVITREAVLEEENFGQLREGDRFSYYDLLHPMLMESSNDAAAAFALSVGKGAFVELMNLEARRLGLHNTYFVNHAGLDPDEPGGLLNYSTAKDLFLFTRILKNTYPEVFSILGLKMQNLYTADERLHHTMQNTNELLAGNGWPTKVLAGKTGWTPEAKGALVLVLESPKEKGYVVNVVLRADNRFQEMQKLVDWVYDSYAW